MPARQTVVVLGASDNPERYSNKAVHELRSRGHLVIPVNPRLIELEGLAVRAGLSEIDEPVDTLSVYLGPAVSGAQLDAILALRPGRVIFNPGSENPELMAALQQAGIAVEQACTLVLLRTDQF
ncbi:MAG: hypothetical protein BWY87_00796 [Deltaproteobacteria bacterium ADurb.Bin510]|nr:MAG: hypothetical protein BWY87_00796 [Deltaproteobacteria bacterium ADurb.Bin510]